MFGFADRDEVRGLTGLYHKIQLCLLQRSGIDSWAMTILLSLLLSQLLSILPRAVGYRCLAKQGVAWPSYSSCKSGKITIPLLSPKDGNAAKTAFSPKD